MQISFAECRDAVGGTYRLKARARLRIRPRFNSGLQRRSRIGISPGGRPAVDPGSNAEASKKHRIQRNVKRWRHSSRRQRSMNVKSLVPAVTIEQARLTTLLRDAAGELGLEAIRTLLNPPLEVTLSVHDTGCHAWIELRSDGLPRVRVWEGSVWYSACYTFNDERKLLGLQPEC